ncbi:MAG: hypothetical protein JXB15_07115, partial [Anaerolineales bacterium]|nr:hypothetical protein [Anaerolineales bacterium]
FLTRLQPKWLEKVWVDGVLGRAKKRLMRNARGAGAKADLVNYGLRNANGRLIAVMRIGCAPYGNAPVIAAVGKELAPHTAYLMRLAGVGLSADDLVGFVQASTLRFRADMLVRNPERECKGLPPRDYRYLLSLDDPFARLIESPAKDILTASNAATGRVYLRSGALDAGMTKSRRSATHYIDAQGNIHSVYCSGKNLAAEKAAQGLRVIHEGAKHRFLWVLALKGTLEYAAWRRVLPRCVKEPEWGKNGLGWTQPRLLVQPPANCATL